MELIKIKLSGFKSFVDPTTVEFPGKRVAIVGPNGCGKSNIIDAVRWVMGESSAKQLRGDALSDVIFNGSTTRKPSGLASVELLFDNRDASLGGPYAVYPEISIKRQVTRDGNSHYSINGTTCRRRDVTDIFLGTGLGPRSYAIIEQGMISRLIEAKPDDLRIYLEETAGISKYKERRRETENRIRHTRENLDRLNDLREELSKQLNHLHKQALAAERYTKLKQEEHELTVKLTTLRYLDLNKDLTQKTTVVQQAETAFEKQMAMQTAITAEIESLRGLQEEQARVLQEALSQSYRTGTEVSRLEQNIAHQKERLLNAQKDKQQLSNDLEKYARDLQADNAQLQQAATVVQTLDPTLVSLKATDAANQERLKTVEVELQTARANGEILARARMEISQKLQLVQAQIENAEKQSLSACDKIKRLTDEIETFDPGPLLAQKSQHETDLSNVEHKVKTLKEQLDEHNAWIAKQIQDNDQLQHTVSAVLRELQAAEGKAASLNALQQMALGQNKTHLTEWLAQFGLGMDARLAPSLTVEAPWTAALEKVLGLCLEAVCLPDLSAVTSQISTLNKGSLVLFETQGEIKLSPGSSQLVPLLSKIKAPWPLDSLLSGIYCATSVQDALSQRKHLAAHESLITPEGFWVGPNWLRVQHDADEKTGVLERKQLLEEIGELIVVLKARLAEQTELLQAGRAALSAKQDARETLQKLFAEMNQSHAQCRAKVSECQAYLTQKQQHAERMHRECAELKQQVAEFTESNVLRRTQIEQWILQLEENSQANIAAQDRVAQLQTRAETLKQETAQTREEYNAMTLKVNMAIQQEQYLRQQSARIIALQTQCNTRLSEIDSLFAEINVNIESASQALHGALNQRATDEANLQVARVKESEISENVRTKEGLSQEKNKAIMQLRAQLEESRLALENSRVREEHLIEQLQALGVEISTLFAMEISDNDASLDAELKQIAEKIRRLGAINLAAIEEHQTCQERAEYLESQYNDLSAALNTLEEAIDKIDQETKARFKETFDAVNGHLKVLFPRVFGGGEAYLEMTGDNLLETGVAIMARPPGKKNSHIHLLSGGEKALTAAALVFSLFKLTPAPFCMLDEVDAPLDEANVARFSRLVTEMSETVQFIFITHNKVTMEMAQYMMGVTMKEPGVSRLVAVDLEEAVEIGATVGA